MSVPLLLQVCKTRAAESSILAGYVARKLPWFPVESREMATVIRKLASGEYRLYSRKKNPKTGKRRNLGTFKTRAAAEKHERAVQFFKRK
jgi:hypothetical protein